MTSTVHSSQFTSHPTLILGSRQVGADTSSFESRQPSFSSISSPSHQSQPQSQHQAAQSHHSNPHAAATPQSSQSDSAGLQNSSNFQGLGDTSSQLGKHSSNIVPQIYTAVYSSVAVYEMEVHGIAVMRRRSDSWLNATQILKVAGVEKGKRTKILEKEILTGQHEKIQGGYGKYQGTWINYRRGREFCRQYGVEDILKPLLDYDMGSDGSGASGHVDTPTKEQAMAANRKRFYSTNAEGRTGSQGSSSTFFQNISPTASSALAAMNKAARFESPMQRSGSAQRRPQSVQRRQSLQHYTNSQQDGYPSGSQQSAVSFASDQTEINGTSDSIYGAAQLALSDSRPGDIQEPPRKKNRPFGQDPYLDPMLHEETPTEPNDSFNQKHYALDSEQGPLSLPPFSAADDKAGEEKRLALLDLFADSSRTDFSSHTAILHLFGQDLDIPLDASANTALHWAATLGRVSLMRQLISRDANIFRGNAAGQTALMAAVQVNNSLDHGCFPEMLEILGPLIEIRDATGRTVLHHIAVSSGIKGRGQSSRYYLESLLAFTVRQGSSGAPSNQQASFGDQNSSSVNSRMKPITLARFMSDVVNVQDKSGNTALNLVARIGNHVIINQLDEVGADYSIANHSGFRPTDFGVFPRSQAGANRSASQQSAGVDGVPNHIDQIREEIFATTSSILTQTHSHYTNELAKSQSVLDRQTAELREIVAEHRTKMDAIEAIQQRSKERKERQERLRNLRQSIQLRRMNVHGQLKRASSPRELDQENIDLVKQWTIDQQSLSRSDLSEIDLGRLPSEPRLRTVLDAYSRNNENLGTHVAQLKSRSSELESQYRKVVSLCSGVEEGKVEEVLESLIGAVESEGKSGAGVGRVREFLRLVEGVE